MIVMLAVGSLIIGPVPALLLTALLDVVGGLALLKLDSTKDTKKLWQPLSLAMLIGVVLGALLLKLIALPRLQYVLGATLLLVGIWLMFFRHRQRMSGKSTLLRTVGTNTVLALAGAPVRARRLKISPLQIGASIRIQDSLQAGASKFYAEITRLRQIVDLTKGDLPVLFLLDEILHGTNSHDRKIGAEGVVRGLVRRGAIGLVTTHDLALTQIVEQLDSRAANVHFEDHLEDGKMTFDYLLRPGVLLKSNALELMRSVGLEI